MISVPNTGATANWRFLFAIFLVLATSYADKQILPLLLEPIKREFDLSDSMVGLLVGAPFTICFTLSSLVLARFADYGDRKKILLISFVVWSVMSGMCGLASGIALLFIARMGVGIGEGGAVPPSYSLVTSYYPASQLGRVFSVLTLASPAGMLLALVGGGYFAEHFGWRAGFLAVALVSVPVGLVALVVLREPRLTQPDQSLEQREAAWDDYHALAKKPSFVFLLLGLGAYSLFVFGPSAFMPTYLVRIMGLDLATAGSIFGTASIVGALVGASIGSFAIDRLKARDVRWLFWLPAVAMLAAWPACVIALQTASLTTFAVMITVVFVLLSAALPSIQVAVQQVCGEHRRATATAIKLIAFNLFGGSLGPLLTGILSDHFAVAFGTLSLRYAMISVTLTFLIAALFFIVGGRSVRQDSEE